MMYAHHNIESPDPITIIDSHLESDEVIDLPLHKKWICRMFNIEPVKKYHSYGYIDVEPGSGISVHCIICTDRDYKYLVTSHVEPGKYEIKGVGLFHELPFIEKESLIVIISKTFIEP